MKWIFGDLESVVEWTVNKEVLIPAALSVCFMYLKTVCAMTMLYLW